MTGKELIIYILQNNLENEPIFKNGKLVGFLTLDEAAARLDVGPASAKLMMDRGSINGVIFPRDTILIADDSKIKRFDI